MRGWVYDVGTCSNPNADTSVVLAIAEEVRQQRAKETKNDTTIELAALLHEVSCHPPFSPQIVIQCKSAAAVCPALLS